MREYKVVELNEGLRFSREKDLQVTEDTLNKYASEGWILHSVACPNDLGGALVGIFYKEKVEK
jgi:hypothetical protein